MSKWCRESKANLKIFFCPIPLQVLANRYRRYRLEFLRNYLAPVSNFLIEYYRKYRKITDAKHAFKTTRSDSVTTRIITNRVVAFCKQFNQTSWKKSYLFR